MVPVAQGVRSRFGQSVFLLIVCAENCKYRGEILLSMHFSTDDPTGSSMQSPQLSRMHKSSTLPSGFTMNKGKHYCNHIQKPPFLESTFQKLSNRLSSALNSSVNKSKCNKRNTRIAESNADDDEAAEGILSIRPVNVCTLAQGSVFVNG
ncbi:unnamed protein product [Sphagnum balticum]